MINEGSNTSWNSQAEMVSSIIDQSPNALAVIEVGGIISFANRKFSEIYAPTLGNPVGMNWRNFISSTATIRRKYNEIADRVFNQKKVWKGEISDIDVNGNTIWRHSTFFPILDKDGNPLRVIYISEDITERKEAEESLRKSEEWNRDIVEHLNDLVYQYDKDFKLMYASPQLVKLVGYKADEVIGTNLDFIISDDYHSQQTSKDFRNRAKKSKKPVKKRDTVKLIHKNGRAIDVEVYRSSMHDIDGRFTGIIGAITDITERKKAEEALQESEEKHKLLVESSLQAILIRQNDEFIFANLAAEHIGGYSKEEYYSMTPQQISELIHPDDREWVLKYAADRLMNQTGIPDRYEFRIITKSGAVKWIEQFASMITINNQTAVHVSYIDITSQKEAKIALEESEEKLRATYQAIPVPTYTWQAINDDFKLIDYNNAAQEYTKGVIVNLMGKKASELYRDNVDILEDMARCFKEKTIIEREMEYKLQSTGEYTTLEVKYAFVPPDLILVHTDDIRERKNAEVALKESEEKYRNVVEQANEGIILVQDGLIKYSNPFILKASGFTEDEFNGTPFVDFVHPDDIELVSERHKERLLKGHLDPYVIRYISKNGDIRWIEIQGSIITWKGKPTLLALLHDITDQRKADEALKQSEELFSKSFKASPNMMVLLDFESGERLLANEAHTIITGYTIEELFGKTLSESGLFKDQTEIKRAIALLSEQNRLENYEAWILKKDGTERLLSLSAEIIISSGRKLAIVSGTDITDKYEAELERKRRMMRYPLEEKCVYLVQEPTTIISLEAFNDLLKFGYDGLAMSRNPREHFWEAFEDDVDFHWLSDRGEGQVISTIEQCREVVEALPPKSAIFIDRLEYLITKHGFEVVMNFVYSIREIAYLQNHVIILSIDPLTIGEAEIACLMKEAREINPPHMGKLPEVIQKTLLFIYSKNREGIQPSYSDIGKELLISKPTVRKRMNDLISRGYITEAQTGATKKLQITDEGKRQVS